MAFQSLFEADVSARSIEPILERHLREADLDEEADAFVRHLVGGVQDAPGRHRCDDCATR